MGEDGRVPPLARRVPGATDKDRPRPAARSAPPKLPEPVLLRMQAAIEAAKAERTAGQEEQAVAEPVAAPAPPHGTSPLTGRARRE